MRCHHLGTALTVVLLVAGCTIQPDDGPRDIALEARQELESADPEAGVTAGTSRIFLIDAGVERTGLSSVPRDVEPTAQGLIEALLAGPNDDELDGGLATAIPAGTQLNAARRVGGTITIDVTAEILDLSGDQFVLAVAQLVVTASELDGVVAVRLRVDGVAQAFPDGAGELQSDPLTVYDFPGLAESAQPAYPAIPQSDA